MSLEGELMQSCHSQPVTLTPYESVREFHKLFGHPVNDIIQTNIFAENPDQVNFRLKLIREEIDEYEKACEIDKNFTEAIDALADTLYVIFGTCLSFGIKYDELFHHEPSRTITHKDLSTYLDENKTMIEVHHIRLDSLMQILKHNCDEGNMDGVINDLNVLVTTVYDFSADLGVDIVGAFNDVHRSNMTKSCSTEEDAIASVKVYKTTQTRYEYPAYRQTSCGKYWVIYNDHPTDSKILKNQVSYDEPHLEVFCNI